MTAFTLPGLWIGFRGLGWQFSQGLEGVVSSSGFYSCWWESAECLVPALCGQHVCLSAFDISGVGTLQFLCSSVGIEFIIRSLLDDHYDFWGLQQGLESSALLEQGPTLRCAPSDPDSPGHLPSSRLAFPLLSPRPVSGLDSELHASHWFSEFPAIISLDTAPLQLRVAFSQSFLCTLLVNISNTVFSLSLLQSG